MIICNECFFKGSVPDKCSAPRNSNGFKRSELNKDNNCELHLSEKSMTRLVAKIIAEVK